MRRQFPLPHPISLVPRMNDYVSLELGQHRTGESATRAPFPKSLTLLNFHSLGSPWITFGDPYRTVCDPK